MRESQGFDYRQPSREMLVGVNLEVSDTDQASGAPGSTSSAQAVARAFASVCLYGHTITVQDDASSVKTAT